MSGPDDRYALLTTGETVELVTDVARTTCERVWGFGSFAVLCRRKNGHEGLHSGRSNQGRIVW